MFSSIRPGLSGCTTLILTVLACSVLSANAAERDLVVEPMQPGPYAVGSMNFEIDNAALTAALMQGRNAGQYQEGANINGEFLYIDSLLENPEEAFKFDLTVPDDTALYGDSAGTTLPVAGYVLYPTSAGNNREDYDVLVSPSLPKMQSVGESPIFENESTLYPLIIYSHGVGDHPTGEQLTFLKDVASHGYMVMALYHGDRRWSDTEARHFNLRPLAVKSALDVLLAHEDFAGHIDVERIGGMGESFGGATMLALLGAKKVNPDVASVIANNLLQLQTDSRIKAAATIVPYAGAGVYSIFGNGSTGVATVDRPFLANSGTADTVADYSKIQDVFNNLSGDKYLVAYQGETHDFTEGANVDASTWMKLFMDAKVKGDADAIETLSRISSVSDSGNDSLAVVEDSSITTPEPEPEPEPSAEPASFASNVLTIPSVVVQGQAYSISMNLLSESPQITFGLAGATPIDTPDVASATFATSTGELSIPVVNVGDVSYAITFLLTDQAQTIFTLTAATEN